MPSAPPPPPPRPQVGSRRVLCWAACAGSGRLAAPPPFKRFESVVVGVGFACGLELGTSRPFCWGQAPRPSACAPSRHSTVAVGFCPNFSLASRTGCVCECATTSSAAATQVLSVSTSGHGAVVFKRRVDHPAVVVSRFQQPQLADSLQLVWKRPLHAQIGVARYGIGRRKGVVMANGAPSSVRLPHSHTSAVVGGSAPAGRPKPSTVGWAARRFSSPATQNHGARRRRRLAS